MASSAAGGKLGIVFHLCGGILFAYTFYEDGKLVSARAGYGGRWKFLTVLNLVRYLKFIALEHSRRKAKGAKIVYFNPKKLIRKVTSR